MQLKTILNRVQKHGSFVYESARFLEHGLELAIEVVIRPRHNGQAVCSGCGRRRPGYDTLPRRTFEFVPLWGMRVFFRYEMRRVACPRCGVVVEKVPWADGKSRLTTTYAWFLARWAKMLSWTQVAEAFRTSWDSVFRAVEMAVTWGREHQDLRRIESIGVDEIQWQRGHHYLTLVYQIDQGCRRLLWIGRERTAATMEEFFDWFGEERSGLLKYICSDMWKPYLLVIAKRAKEAIHILDRYHIVAKLNKAIDQVRAAEARALKAAGYEPILKRSRWCLLKRPENLTEKQETKLAELLRYNLKAVRAYLLKEDLDGLWDYVSPYWAGKFLKRWCTRAMRSRLEPIKTVAKTLRKHHDLILNWFRASGEISAGIVEGYNNKAKLTTRKAYGFRSFRCISIALFHALGNLPERQFTHRFC